MEDNACVLLRNPRSLRVMLLFLTEWGEIIEHLSFWQYSFRWQFCGKRTVSNFLWRMKVNSHFSDIKCLRRRSHNCSLCHCEQLIRSLWISIFLCKKKSFAFIMGWEKWLTLILKQNSAWLHSISIKIFRILFECGGWNVRNSYVSFVNSQHSKFKFLVPRGSDKLWELSLVTGGRRKSLFWINSDIE